MTGQWRYQAVPKKIQRNLVVDETEVIHTRKKQVEVELGMLLIKAVEENWGLMGPGSWEKRSWKINSDGTYQRKTTYRPVDPEDVEDYVVTEEGALYEEQMDVLRECIEEYWNNEKSDACDGSAWEFKLYDKYGSVICHREMGYIYGIEPYESIAALLYDEDNSEDND